MSTPSAAAADRRQFLSFTLAGCDYGVPILHVREILQYEEVTRVPSVPPWIRGVINLRGAVVPVVDLALKLGLPETVPTGRSCILIVEVAAVGEASLMGVLADTVIEVLDLAPDDVESAPAFGTGIRVEQLTGMAKVGKGFVLLLDVERALSGEAELRAGEPAARPEVRP